MILRVNKDDISMNNVPNSRCIKACDIHYEKDMDIFNILYDIDNNIKKTYISKFFFADVDGFECMKYFDKDKYNRLFKFDENILDICYPICNNMFEFKFNCIVILLFLIDGEKNNNNLYLQFIDDQYNIFIVYLLSNKHTCNIITKIFNILNIKYNEQHLLDFNTKFDYHVRNSL